MKFERFVTTVGTNGTIAMPLFDSEGGIPLMRIGPGFDRNSVRFFVKMPELDDVGHLPAPMNADRKTVTFEPRFVFINSPIPMNCEAKFTRIISGKEKGKMTKKEISKWQANQETTIYPAANISMAALRPGDTIELEGVSYFKRERIKSYAERKREKKNLFAWSGGGNAPPPNAEMRHPIGMVLLVKLNYLPKTGARKKYRVVEGSPLTWSNAPQAQDPDDSEKKDFVIDLDSIKNQKSSDE